MQKHKSRSFLARALAVGVTGMAASLIIGAGVASASPADPPGGVTPVPPHFYNGNVEQIRGTGSDTTIFMMQRISDLYTGAGLYGCTLNTTSGVPNFNSSDTTTSNGSNAEFYCVSGGNISTTDVNDNWDRTEVAEGVDDVGSGAGQEQLCSALSTPLNVDFARSSKPASQSNCPTGGSATLEETGYAKDGVDLLDYNINPSTYGTAGQSASNSPSSSLYASINGGNVGPVTLGWLPGDPTTCTSGNCSGTKFTNISNIDNGGGASSTAYRIWCTAASTTGSSGQINDWGQLTNIGPSLQVQGAQTTATSTAVTWSDADFPAGIPSIDALAGDAISGTGIPSGDTVSSVSGTTINLNTAANATGTVTLTVNTAVGGKLAVGQGLPVGIPLRVVGVNTASGTEATWAQYANSGQGTGAGLCQSNMDANAANDPNPATAPSPNAPHIALENDSDQIDQFSIGDWGPTDFVDQAIEDATSLYFISNGVYNTNPYTQAATVDGTSYSGTKINLNGQSATAPVELSNVYPTARALFNIYDNDTVRASTAGFLNWICDSNTNFSKGLDNSTGSNFDTELTTLISTNFGFPRLTDTSAVTNPLTAAQTIPADDVSAPNNTCSASEPVTVTSGSDTITITGGGNFPVDIVNAGGLVGGASVQVLDADFATGTTVVSGAGTSTLTLSSNATAGGTSVATVFGGVPPVTSVASAQS